tara:strand:+ start:388 stop:696 length:309 start_codon:yes stop_codon:yes gene_type:complete
MSSTMRQEYLFKIIDVPHISEKSSFISEKSNQVVFKVNPTATKKEIKEAVEMYFEVKVENVTVMNMKGKERRHGQTKGRLKSWKKAYVKLSKDDSIDFSSSA